MIHKQNLVEALADYSIATDSTVAVAVDAITERFVESIIEGNEAFDMTYEEIDVLNDAIRDAIEGFSEDAEKLVKEWNKDARDEYNDIEEAKRGQY